MEQGDEIDTYAVQVVHRNKNTEMTKYFTQKYSQQGL